MGPGLRKRYRKRHRLSHALEYAAVRARGVRKARGDLFITLLPTNHPQHRLGLQVGKRIGNAVRRGRAKRLIREAFRLSNAELPTPAPGSNAYDIVVSARAMPRSLKTCTADLTAAVNAAHRACRKRDQQDRPA
ncbi:MAG: ribonuclease P protein component [Planctomycetota bacterium]